MVLASVPLRDNRVPFALDPVPVLTQSEKPDGACKPVGLARCCVKLFRSYSAPHGQMTREVLMQHYALVPLPVPETVALCSFLAHFFPGREEAPRLFSRMHSPMKGCSAEETGSSTETDRNQRKFACKDLWI
jgi:hypothetical protein